MICTAGKQGVRYTLKELILQADGSASLLVQGDRVKVQQIVQNLVFKALKNNRKGVISVSWSLEGVNWWSISVQDSLSVPVSLCQPTETGKLPIPDGKGIELYIIKQLCELLSANLVIDHQPGKVTLFRVRFRVDQTA